jgi:hypothetical protein
MRNYIKSLLPYRWIILLVFLVLSQSLFLCFNALGFPLNDTIIFSIVSPFFWIAIDLLFGLGRVSPLSNRPLIQISLALVLYGVVLYSLYINYK